jgi:iron complex outermembrane receptor protein
MRRILLAALLLLHVAIAVQAAGLKGRVTMDRTGDPVHRVTVRVVQLGMTIETDQEGFYEFDSLPPGAYDVVAHMHPFSDDRKRVEVAAKGQATLDFQLKLSPIHESITVTASGREESTLEAFQTVTSLESLELIHKSAASMGDVLDNETGIAKRSSGPGTTRPVVRGFDGDRVLIMQDGIPTGTLSYQSGDHGEPVDATALDRVEVVRGPATLLYGSNAIGGVVNAISSHHQVHQHPHEGVRGHLTALGGTNNNLGGGSGGFEYGRGAWLLWGGGGGQRTGDYETPLGVVENSHTRMNQASVGLGRFGDRYFGSLGYGLQDGKYGIPVPPEEDVEVVDLAFRRQSVRFNGGVKDLNSVLERFALTLNYSDWNHKEMAEGEVHNRFLNRQFLYRGVVDQKRRGHLTGSFGFMGSRRDYKAQGEEVITPPVIQNSFALFALEQVDFERFRLQFGGRVEHTGYSPDGMTSRSFNGFSGAAGIQVPLWHGGVFVTNYTHSFRAPALEELYANGPHAGNLTFEIGDARLKRERSEGLDLSVRHQSSRVRGELNFFQYWLSDYVFLSPTGNIEDGLIEAEYKQADARYRGTEARLDLGLHQNLWLNLGMDAVRAELARTDTPLPRIPPLRGRIGLDARYRGFSLRPGVILANDQDRIFPTETRTAGYSLFNLNASYIVTQRRALHVFGMDAFNLGNRLYRNHLSFIRDFAPEIGRGVRFYYTVQFF